MLHHRHKQCFCRWERREAINPRPTGPRHRHRCSVTATAASKEAVVIGAGIGGLVAACKLAQQGLKVTILEQNSEVGGRCQSQYVQLEEGSFRFDTGPSLALFPNTYYETFKSLGVRLEDYVEMRRVDPSAYTVWFDGSCQLQLHYDVQRMLQQLEQVEPGAGRAYLGWLASARSALEVGTREFIKRDFDSVQDMIDLGRLAPLLGQVDPFELLGQHHGRLKKWFKDPRLQALFSFQDLYVGLTPYTAPGVFSLLAATEITDGVFYPVGGFTKIKDALATIAGKLGVQVQTNTQVGRIATKSVSRQEGQDNATSQGLQVTGVQLSSGKQIPADLVVSNRDVPLTYELLENTEYGKRRHANLSSKQYSAAVIAYNFCVKGRLNKLAHHNVFLSGEYERSWQRAISAATLLQRPNFYVHCPARSDAGAAPEGYDSIMVLLPVANMQEVQRQNKGGQPVSYTELIEAGRQAIAHTFKADGVCDDFLSQVIHEFVIGPEEWQARYGIQHGAVFGLSHGLDQLAAFRPALKDDKVKGLYLVGASTRPGNGVPLVMISADLVAKRIAQDLQAGLI